MRLTEEESKYLNQFYEGTDKVSALIETSQQWSSIVKNIEDGYDDDFYEYTNDLFFRESLEAMTESAPHSLAEKIHNLLEPADNQFLKSTRILEARLLPDASDRTRLNIWHRIPSKLSDTLRISMEREGFKLPLN